MRSLFPDEVVLVVADAALAAEPLHPAEAAEAGRMSAARRREFALGRACARRALAGLGIRDAPLLRGEGRAPRWPAGIIGSLTHTEGFCAAAVARRGALLGLGLDAESAPLSPRAARRVLDAEERRALGALPAPPACGFESVAFSAKESVFKAVFPLRGHRLGFRDAAISVDPGAGRFEVRLRAECRDALPPGARLEGRYAVDAGLVLTSVVVVRGPR
jgi:4'-phosphopantetheinyl transferase EntD